VEFSRKDDKNIIKNSKFTESPQGGFSGGWFAPRPQDMRSGESWAIVPDTFSNGGKSLMLKSKEKVGICITQYLPEMKPDTEYLLTFFMKMENVSGSGVCVNVWDDRNRWFPTSFYTGTMPWTKQGFRFKSNPETNKKTKSYIRLRLMGASGTAWFDDVRLREVTK